MPHAIHALIIIKVWMAWVQMLFSTRKCQGADKYFLNAETWGQKQKDRPHVFYPCFYTRGR